jgi:hypothetical protein
MNSTSKQRHPATTRAPGFAIGAAFKPATRG